MVLDTFFLVELLDLICEKNHNNGNLKIKKSSTANFLCQFVLLLIVDVDQIKVFLSFLALRKQVTCQF